MADGESGRAALAACAARRWLARNAAGVKLVRSRPCKAASACISLVSCLPALEDVLLSLDAPLVKDDLGCLLEALAGCPCLRALDLSTVQLGDTGDKIDVYWPFPDAATFAKLRCLTKLALSFRAADQFCLADMVSALVPLTGLAELSLKSCQPAVVPAALGHLKGLRSLMFSDFGTFDLEAGCLNLPNLLSLEFVNCYFQEDAQVLPGVTAFESVTRIVFTKNEFSGTEGSFFLNPQRVRLPRLQQLVWSRMRGMCDCSSTLHGIGLPAGMGLLSSSLLQLDISGSLLSHFPLALTQLVALECLDASWNRFAKLPAGITALSRLKDLTLGRIFSSNDPLHGKRLLDVRALGDLSLFPALRELTLMLCEVVLCPSLLGAVRHASLAKVCFYMAHPAPECAPVVLQLNWELGGLRRGTVVTFKDLSANFISDSLAAACQKFKADLDACGQ